MPLLNVTTSETKTGFLLIGVVNKFKSLQSTTSEKKTASY